MSRPVPGPRTAGAWHPVHLAPAALGGLIGFVLILVTLRHGFDWSDEAFVWTMIASDRLALGEAWGFQHLLHPLFTMVGESVLVMRALRLLGYVAVSVVLARAASRVLRAAGLMLRRREQAFVLLVAQAGTLLAWSYPPRYLGYNELSAWLGALICAAVAVGVVPSGSGDRRLRALPWAVVGFLLGPLVLAKLTAAIVWAALVLTVLLLPVPGSQRWLRLVAVAVGAAVSTVAMVLTGVPFLAAARSAAGMLLDSSAQAASDHSISEILQTYLTSTEMTARATAVPILLLMALTAVCLLVRRRLVLGGLAGALLAAAFAAVLARPAIEGTWPALGSLAAALGVGGALMLVPAARATLPAGSPVLRLVVVLLLALGAPLVAAVGTNNLIWGHTVFSATAWAVLCGVALCLLARVASPVVRAAPLLLGTLVVALTSTAVAFEVSVHPYRSSPLLSQQTPTSVPPLAGMLLTEDQAAVADFLRSVAVAQNARGVPAVALNSPGHLFMFNRSGWASPWTGDSWQASIARTCAQDGAPEDLFVVQPAGPENLVKIERGRLQEALAGCRLQFPDDFTAVAEGDGVVVWRFQDR